MRESVCNGNPTCLHGEGDSNEDVDMEGQVEESDPSGRYIRYKEILGKGAFKTVYRGFDDVTGIEVAWNQIKLQDILRSPQDLERLYSEVHLLKTLKHRNIIKFHHSWVDTKTNRINIITELFSSGTLRQYRKRHKHVDLRAVKNWCRQILRGLLYLHSHDPPIIHRDLKCDNIFINGNQGEVKIGDLGLAAILCQAPAAHSIIGTPEFMAPELYEEEYTELVDIYSFGMCLLEMVTFEYPYSECDNAAQIYKKVSSGIKPAALDKLKDVELREFVEKCIAMASKRLPARELLMDPFLRGDMDQDDGPILSRNASKPKDMEDFGALLQGTSFRTALFTNSETSSASLAPTPLPAVQTVHFLPKSPIRQLGSADVKQDKAGRNVDLRVKGKRRENDIVCLRLRMAAEGNIRVIHFPFDVEADTAMCVASEMVEELDLADQDVTKIAEMIDAAVLLLVPEWKPGVAIDERCEVDESSGPIRQGSAGATLALLSRQRKTIHGRFEEVMYHHHRHHQGNHEEEPCTLTTADEVADDWEQSDMTSSSDASPVCQDVPCDLSGTGDRGAANNFIGFFESSDLANTAGKPSDLSLAGGDLYSRVMDAWALFQDDFGGDDGDSELLVQEIKNLTLQFQQDLKDIHDGHQKALLELKKQWHGRRGAQHAISNGGKMKDDQAKETTSEAYGHERFLENTWSKNSKKDKNTADEAGRLSFKELAALLAQVEPPEELNKSSVDDSTFRKVCNG